MHLDLDLAVAGAVLAPPAADVEREPARKVAADPGLGDLAEELADVVEHPRVGRRVRARGPADRRLVDVDHLVDLLPPRQPPMPARQRSRAIPPSA